MSSQPGSSLERLRVNARIVAANVIANEEPEVERGHNGRAGISQVAVVGLAHAYLDLAAAVENVVNDSSGIPASVKKYLLAALDAADSGEAT